MKKICSTLILASIFLSTYAEIEDGKTYRIALAENNSKSLFLPNATKENLSQVVIWTETDVPAQQWTVTKSSDGRYSFRNVYSGNYLNYVNKQIMQIDSKNSFWTLEAVDEEQNIYRLKKTSTYLYATLHQGANTLTFTGIDGAMPEVEKIEITYLTSVSNVLEAEYGKTRGEVKIENSDEASGGRYTSFIGGGSANTLTFICEAEEQGTYDLYITYFAGETRSMYVDINGDKTVHTFENTGSFDANSAAIKTVSITLNTGTNTIVLGNTNGWAPNVDCIELKRTSPESGITPPPAQQQHTITAYDLQGRRIDPATTQGIIIINGKKILQTE